MNSPEPPFSTCEQWQAQTLLVEGQVAEITRSFSWRTEGDGWSYAGNRLLVCPRCQRTWAFLDFGQPMGFEEPAGCIWPVAAVCERCPAVGPVPAGSLLQAISADGRNFDLPLLWALPESLLRREFNLHLTALEKEITDG